MLWIFIVVLGVVVASNIAGFIISAPGYQGPESDHFNGKTFTNKENVKAKGFLDVIRWSVTRQREEWQEPEQFQFGKKPQTTVNGDTIKITFINHATLLIQTSGLNILTDPIWSERPSPVSFLGPKRKTSPGIRFEDLPTIDVVIISHNHYDHLDVPTVTKLQKEHNPRFFVPLGVSVFLKGLGVQEVEEMDWWHETALAENISLACVPAQHFSGRGPFDRDKTLWAGFVIQTSGENIYFAGDTGYGSFFSEIRERYAPFKLALLPIGAYKPSWFMSPIHISPEEAVKVHQEMQIDQSVAIHFGTFPLADDGMKTPVDDLKKAIRKYGLNDGEFRILENGESLLVK